MLSYCVVDIKLKKYHEALTDCEHCLYLEPKNIKSLLRKADALIALDKTNDAHKVYCKVLEIDPNNMVAKKAIETIPIR